MLASSRARFHPGYARIGTSPDAGLSWTLPATLGHEQAMRFFLRPKMHDAGAALADDDRELALVVEVLRNARQVEGVVGRMRGAL